VDRFLYRFYPETRFGGFTDCDGTIRFYTRINALAEEVREGTVLDVGCGRGAYADDLLPLRAKLRVLRGRCARVIGLDVDPTARENPFIDEFYFLRGSSWPLDDSSIDLCLADCVIEHVTEPDVFFAECMRVIKPGGYVCIRTTNVYSYIGLASRLIPNKYHGPVLQKAQGNRKVQDVFPTVYRCNSTRKLRGILDRYGFDAIVYGSDSEPMYLAFSRFAYWLGVLHQRYAPNCWKPTILAFGKKR